jgi:GNAT superfamily N-acetyltransferase
MRLRRMTDEDVETVNDLTVATFEDLSRRSGEPPGERPPADAAYVRLRRLLDSDPDGCWVAEEDGALAGAALALLREGVWGLSLLVVRPDMQSRGVGGALLDRTLVYADGARGGIILSSSDARAQRVYGRAGFARHPTSVATGSPRGVIAAPEVRPFTDADHPAAASIGRAVRGAAHGADLDALAAAGCELLAYPGRGYAAHRGGAVKVLAAADDEAAAALLRTVLARMPADAEAEVEWLTASKQWAIDVVQAAGLDVRPYGALFLRGETGSFRPYLPGGAYL